MLKSSIYYLIFKLRCLPAIYSLGFVLKFLIYNCIIPFCGSCFMWIIPPLNFSLKFLVYNPNYILKLPFYNFDFELKFLRATYGLNSVLIFLIYNYCIVLHFTIFTSYTRLPLLRSSVQYFDLYTVSSHLLYL